MLISPEFDPFALHNLVEDTSPQLGGALDLNGNLIKDGTKELLEWDDARSELYLKKNTSVDILYVTTSLTVDTIKADEPYGIKLDDALNLNGNYIDNASADHILAIDGSDRINFYKDLYLQDSYDITNVNWGGFSTLTGEHVSAGDGAVPTGITKLLVQEDAGGPQNGPAYPLRIRHDCPDPSPGIGVGVEFDLEDTAGNYNVLGRIEVIASNITDGTEETYMAFQTADIGDDGVAERMRIDKDGNVGIGTTPSVKLDVNGKGSFTGDVKGNNFEVGTSFFHAGDTDTQFAFLTDGFYGTGAGSKFFNFLNSGKQPLMTFNGNGIDMDFQVKGSVDVNLFYINAGTNKVGISTNAPNKTFDVGGDISLEAGSGDYYSNDGSQGWSGSFTNGDANTVTVKNGIITGVA